MTQPLKWRTLINLLKQELKTTQENLKLALEENSKIVESLSCVKEKAKTLVVQTRNDYNDFINDIPFDASLSKNFSSSLGESSQKSDYYTIENQLTRFRQKMHTDFTSKSNKSKIQEKRSDCKNNKKTAQVVKTGVQDVTENAVKNSTHNRDQVIICGDSLLNNIEGKGLSSKSLKASVKNFWYDGMKVLHLWIHKFYFNSKSIF